MAKEKVEGKGKITLDDLDDAAMVRALETIQSGGIRDAGPLIKAVWDRTRPLPRVEGARQQILIAHASGGQLAAIASKAQTRLPSPAEDAVFQPVPLDQQDPQALDDETDKGPL